MVKANIVLRRSLKLAIAGALAFVAMFAILWGEHHASVELPLPTGPFAVGRVLTAWTDDGSASSAGQKRELVVWIWFPATAPPNPISEDYVSAPLRAEVERARGILISQFLTRDLSRVHPHSARKADLSPGQRSYPVAILRAGASAEVWNYTTLAEDLASHGYVVVGFDAPSRTNVVVLPDGRVFRRMQANNPESCLELQGAAQERCASRIQSAWTADIAFVLDRLSQWNTSDPSGRFTGRLDLTRVGVFGHSFGGATAAQFCHDDSRCTAGIDVDGAPHGSVVQAGMHQPFMFLLSDHGKPSDPESRQIQTDIQSIYDRLPPERRVRIVIRGANHFLFSDDGALLKSHIVLRSLRLLGIVGIDGRRQLAVTAYCIRTFFDAHLKDKPAPALGTTNPLYPEIESAP